MKNFLILLILCGGIFGVNSATADAQEFNLQFCNCAYNEEDFQGKIDFFVIANCKEWVTLRSAPSTSATALARIPLGTRVAVWDVDSRNGFLPVRYKKIKGYVLEQYLKFVSMS